ncbi:hypothetical protein LHJ74_15760 [Streptomyces sp. N2-109]|uniref:YokE-like PH domain-containing protein n=1 Tax=Streptomyces gossypii TaxID=2883101 RepID=A0ABT2JTZ8_9ACTN|nr:hypothetical protein [Streptomyces gossypii]MCT2591345.1 hypothetical protein [Streptomyces gossypii]
MTEPEFDAGGVRIERWLRSLTRGGRVLIRDGRLELLTSYGREIDSAPLEQVRISGRYGMRGRAVATLGGTRYLLRLGLAHRAGLLAALRTAQAKSAAERGVLGR